MIHTGDNLGIMRAMPDASVHLVYLDPPFKSDRQYRARAGSGADGASFKDTWGRQQVDQTEMSRLAGSSALALVEAARATHGDTMYAYLAFMAPRLVEAHRLLTPTGSVFLHCDPTAGHYLKLLMDAIFGHKRHRNEIVWCYTGPGSSQMRQFNRKHDTIHWYSKGDAWRFDSNAVRVPYVDDGPHVGGFATMTKPLDDAARREYSAKGKIPETWWSRFTPVGRLDGERLGYPTQKPLALLRRIIIAASVEDETVLDPFCGSGTTLVAAAQLNRKFVGIDISATAVELAERRLHMTQKSMKLGA